MTKQWVWSVAAAFLWAAAPACKAAPAESPSEIAQTVLGDYIAAWDRADAAAIARAFAPDGDFINPGGVYARGRHSVATFYRSAFDRGYAGSHGTFAPRIVRRLSRDTIAVDGEWSISGARMPNGAARPPEAGIATAILVRREGRWRVAVLREQSGADRINP